MTMDVGVAPDFSLYQKPSSFILPQTMLLKDDEVG
jgi:hypothetical protein